MNRSAQVDTNEQMKYDSSQRDVHDVANPSPGAGQGYLRWFDHKTKTEVARLRLAASDLKRLREAAEADRCSLADWIRRRRCGRPATPPNSKGR